MTAIMVPPEDVTDRSMTGEGETWAYRCGRCGMPCDASGEPLGDDAPKTAGETKMVNGECCRPGGDGIDRRFVTREMALDAGMPELEGWEL